MKETGCWMFLSNCLGFISGFVCELERMHMLVIYIEYQGLFMFGLENLNSPKSMKHIQISFPQLSFRTTMSSGTFSNHILT